MFAFLTDKWYKYIGDSMTDEEIKAYVQKIEEASVDEVEKILSSLDTNNLDIKISRICDGVSENIRVLKQLNVENGDDVLHDDILEMSKKLYVCSHYLDEPTVLSDEVNNDRYRLVFVTTLAGKPYFEIDLSKVPKEAYDEVLNVLKYMFNFGDHWDSKRVKYYTNNNLPQKILEFKGYQIRIFTVLLKKKILGVVGLTVKKADNPKVVSEFLKKRLSATSQQIDCMKKAMSVSDDRNQLLLDGDQILSDIMQLLNKKDSDEVELLFPSDDELLSLTPDEVLENKDDVNLDHDSKKVSKQKHIELPETAVKIKRRGRGLGKKTIARNEINASLKGLSLEELMQVQNFVTRLKMDKGLNDTIGNIYEVFLNMSNEEINRFENSIKNFKYDDIGRSK